MNWKQVGPETGRPGAGDPQAGAGICPPQPWWAARVRLCHGTHRLTLLIGRWALKVPHLRSWRMFLQGLLGNMQERDFSTLSSDKLCPIVLSLPGGFLNVMPRCNPVTETAWENLDAEFFQYDDTHDCPLPVECKRDSFGVLNGRVVCVDYA